MNKIYTKEDIISLLERNDIAVERAILFIYSQQTKSEQYSRTTTEHNSVGFNAADAKTGTYLATWLLSGKHLSGRFLDKGRKMAKKYVRQLVERANKGDAYED